MSTNSNFAPAEAIPIHRKNYSSSESFVTDELYLISQNASLQLRLVSGRDCLLGFYSPPKQGREQRGMRRMNKEVLDKFIGRECRLILENGFGFSGKLESIEKDVVKFRDRYEGLKFFDVSFVRGIGERENGNKQFFGQ
jgi:hypothetical protein